MSEQNDPFETFLEDEMVAQSYLRFFDGARDELLGWIRESGDDATWAEGEAVDYISSAKRHVLDIITIEHLRQRDEHVGETLDLSRAGRRKKEIQALIIFDSGDTGLFALAKERLMGEGLESMDPDQPFVTSYVAQLDQEAEEAELAAEVEGAEVLRIISAESGIDVSELLQDRIVVCIKGMLARRIETVRHIGKRVEDRVRYIAQTDELIRSTLLEDSIQPPSWLGRVIEQAFTFASEDQSPEQPSS